MEIVIWSKPNCTFCEQAKTVLNTKKIAYKEKKIGDGYSKEDLLEVAPNARSVPQIFIDGSLIGGYQDLVKFLNTKE